MRRPTALAAACCAIALVAGPAYAASDPGDPLGSSPTSSSGFLDDASGAQGSASSSPSPPRGTAHPTSPSYTPPADAPDAVTKVAKVHIKPANTFSVKVDPKAKKPSRTWPDASRVFVESELSQILPGLTSVTTSGCEQISLPGGDTSVHNGTCVLTLHLKGEPKNDPSRIVVDVRGFGTADQMGQRWDRELTAQRARAKTRPGLYTFYKNGSLGVTSAYTDGTITRVLLTKGPVTGVIWFSGVGFTTLADTYLDSRRAYRDVIIPELITLLGEKMQGR